MREFTATEFVTGQLDSPCSLAAGVGGVTVDDLSLLGVKPSRIRVPRPMLSSSSCFGSVSHHLCVIDVVLSEAEGA